MDKAHREILRRNRVVLGEELEPELLLNHLIQDNILRPEHEEEIRAASISKDRVYKLLKILPTRGKEAFHCFIEALEEQQPHLAELLRKDEVISQELCNSAKLRLQLSETKKELERVKEKNLTIQIENEELKRTQVDKQIQKLHEQLLKTEDNLKQHLEDVLERKAKDIATHMPPDQELFPNSRRSSINEEFYRKQFLQIIQENCKPGEDENGNVISHDRETLNIMLQSYEEREKALESECNELRDKLKSMEEDRPKTPITQAAWEDSANCKECETLGQKYVDLKDTSTQEIQWLNNATKQYRDKITTLQNDLSAQQSLYEESKDESIALNERFKTLLDENQSELRSLKNEVERLKNKTESDARKLANSREKKKSLEEENKQLLKDKETICQSAEEDKKKREKEMADFQKIANEAQKECAFLKTEIEKWKSLPGKVLNFKKEFSNGVIQTLITESTKRKQPYPFTAMRSSDAHGHAKDIFNHSETTHSGTENREHSWWQIDLGEDVLLFPNHYTLRHGKENGLAVIINWKLEGSRDGNKWQVLREHKNERGWFSKRHGSYPFHTGSWSIEGPIVPVRYLRIYQTGKNSAGDHALYLSGVEFYGVLLYMCKGD